MVALDLDLGRKHEGFAASCTVQSPHKHITYDAARARMIVNALQRPTTQKILRWEAAIHSTGDAMSPIRQRRVHGVHGVLGFITLLHPSHRQGREGS